MTQDEIRKLLGGYSTNALTEGERAALFEAALEDQDLFNALQNEDALREALADPVSLAQVRQALAEPTRRASWTGRPWLIGTAGVALASAIVIAVLVWQRTPSQPAPAIQIASTQNPQTESAPKAIEPQPSEPRDAVTPKMKRKPAPRPSPPVAAATPAGAVMGAIGGAMNQDAAVNAPLYNGPLLRTSVLRSGPSGDRIRIEVVSQVTGNLALYRIDAAGQWQHVFPMNAPEMPIAANTTYQIPDDPITSTGNQDKLRLVINPTDPSLRSQVSSGQLSEPRAAAVQQKTAVPAPLVMEIAIGPN